jgi:RNA polymerase sigma factor (sigma-70 family)
MLLILQQTPDDQDAWESLYCYTWPFVRAMCHRALPVGRRVFDAEDVAQEAFLKFYRYWLKCRPPIRNSNSLFALLAVMARQLARDTARWQGRARRDIGRQTAAHPELAAGAEGQTGTAEVDVEDLLERVRTNLDEVSLQILNLRMQGYTVVETAVRVGLSDRTIERRLHQIRAILEPHFSLDEL